MSHCYEQRNNSYAFCIIVYYWYRAQFVNLIAVVIQIFDRSRRTNFKLIHEVDMLSISDTVLES